MYTINLFVSEIRKTSTEVLVTAVNGTLDGPPRLSWYVDAETAKTITIGKRYKITIEAE